MDRKPNKNDILAREFVPTSYIVTFPLVICSGGDTLDGDKDVSLNPDRIKTWGWGFPERYTYLFNLDTATVEQMEAYELLKSPDKDTVLYGIEILKNLNKS